MYLGSSKCELISDHDILNMFYDVLLSGLDAKEEKQLSYNEMGNGGLYYKESMIGTGTTTAEEETSDDDDDDSDSDISSGHRHRTEASHWSYKDPSSNVCEWKGVKCDSKREILSFRFPTPFMEE